MDLPREEHDPDRVTYLEERTGKGIKVHVNDVTFGYDEHANVYEHSDLEVSSGEIVAIMAESGGGKTTLIRLLLGMLEPDSGKVTLQSGSGEEFPVNSDLRKFFAYVPQGNTMFSGTIAENMRMVNETATDEDVINALKTACAWDFVEHLPEGINSKLGERGRGLSEGQAQRISIARALLRNSPILLLDEATSALDRDTEEQVLHNIMSSHPDRLIILSTHRPAALKLCNHIYKISGGKISETTIEDALEIQRVLAERQASSSHGVNYDKLIKPMAPMGPQEDSPADGNDEGGWWNS